MANKKKILLIEDNKPTAESIKGVLKDNDFEVVLEETGDGGQERALEADYDLLLLDLWLPKVNGFEILESLNEKMGKDKRPPVIILSNSGQPVEIGKAEDMGVRDYLIKADFTPEEVLEKVKTYLN